VNTLPAGNIWNYNRNKLLNITNNTKLIFCLFLDHKGSEESFSKYSSHQLFYIKKNMEKERVALGEQILTASGRTRQGF
jgi:hypothetical protein